jgi:hypothetical protein
VLHDPIPEVVVDFPAGPAKAVALVESLRAPVVGVRPEVCAIVAARLRFGDGGLDDTAADALAPAVRDDED